MGDEEILEEREGLSLKIVQDDCPMSPDEWEDDGVFLVGFHRQFWVVREDFKKPEDVESWRETHEVTALHGYIHSGVALSLSDQHYPFNDRWDACQVGYVLVKKGEPTEKVSAEQMAQIANSVPQDVDAEKVEWMPLGVFALVKEDQEEPTMFLQLAVSKEGIIGGTYNNTITNSALSVEGMVDKGTQRAVWTIGENKNTTLETGIYGLTQEETPVLVHFGTEQTQQWLLVRLEEPPETEPE